MRRIFLWVSFALVLIVGAIVWTVRPKAQSSERTTTTEETGEESNLAAKTKPPSPIPPIPPRRDPTAESKPGEAFTVELMDPPEQAYGNTQPTAADKSYSNIVAKLGRSDIVYDPALGRAARELSLQQSLLDGLVPQDIVNFILRSSGAVDRTVEQVYSEMSDDSEAALQRQVEKFLHATTERGPARIGIGEAWIPGAKRSRIVGMLFSRSDLVISPAPRTAARGGTWVMRGILPSGFHSPSALALMPNGELVETPVLVSGSRFEVSAPVGNSLGTIEVSMGAIGPLGHAPIWQVPIAVGRELQTSYETNLPPDESAISTIFAAEKMAFDLLNADRKRAGLSILVRDRDLDNVARAHSEDMREHNFFGHHSPNTGDPKDRLMRAGYRFRSFGENLALEMSLYAAQSALLASLGHRKNILGDFSHVGIGIARSDHNGKAEWRLTQLFSKPVEIIQSAAGAEQLIAKINETRVQKRTSPLSRDKGLFAIAETHVRKAAAGQMAGLADLVLADVSRSNLAQGGSRAWVFQTGTLSDLKLPEGISDSEYNRIAVSVFQSPDDPRGAIGVIVLVAADRH